MSKKLNIEDIRKKSKECHKDIEYFIPDQDFINNRSKIKILCSKCGEYFFQKINNHLNGRGCPVCFGKHKKTLEEIREESKIIHDGLYEIPDQPYQNNKSKIKILCKKCNQYFFQSTQNHLNKKQGCYHCNGNIRLTLKNIRLKDKELHGDKFEIPEQEIINNRMKIKIYCKTCNIFFYRNLNSHLIKNHTNYCPKCSPTKKLTLDIIRNRSKKIHGYQFEIPEQEFFNIKSSIKIFCKKCNQNFEQKILVHIDKRIRGCPNCNKSKGEKQIEKYLKENQIEYLTQKRFEDCKYILSLPFDFYLPKYNTCIEYDGELHFKPIDFFGGTKSLKEHQRNDNIKNQFCKSMNINLFRIKYDENIIEKIESIYEKIKKL